MLMSAAWLVSGVAARFYPSTLELMHNAIDCAIAKSDGEVCTRDLVAEFGITAGRVSNASMLRMQAWQPCKHHAALTAFVLLIY